MATSFDKIVVDNLRAIVGAWCEATGASIATASKKFYGKTDFFQDLFAGERSISVVRVSQMMVQLRAEWPPGGKWPSTRAVLMGRDAQD